MARKKEIAAGFVLVKYRHNSFNWRGKGYNLNKLTVAQAEELFESGWPHIALAAKPKDED